MFDRHHLRVVGRLAEELHHHIKTLKRVMHHEILVADGSKAIAAKIPDTFGEPGIERREQQIVAFLGDQLAGVGKAQQAIEGKHIGGLDRKLVGKKIMEFRAGVGVYGQANDVAAPAPLDGTLEEADEIFGLFLNFDVAVPQYPEQADFAQFEGRKQAIDEQAHHIFDGDIADRLARQSDEALDLFRNDHQPGKFLIRPVQFHHQAKALVGHEREGVSRIHGDRRQHRENRLVEMFAKPQAVIRPEALGIHHRDAGRMKQVFQLMPGLLLQRHNAGNPVLNRLQLGAGGHAVQAGHRHIGVDKPPETGHPDHVELVQIGGRDGKKTKPFQKGVGRVGGLLQNTIIEGKPRQLAIDVAIGCRNDVGSAGCVCQAVDFDLLNSTFFHQTLDSGQKSWRSITHQCDRYVTTWDPIRPEMREHRVGNGEGVRVARRNRKTLILLRHAKSS